MKTLSHGFSLLELLVVIAIIGILSGIAIPQFADYRKRAFDVRALSDVRSVALAEEAYFIDNDEYLACDGAACAELLPGIVAISEGVELSVAVPSADEFEVTGTHPRGSGQVYIWNNVAGGLSTE